MPSVPASRQGHQGQLEYRAPRGAADGLSLPPYLEHGSYVFE